MISPLGWWCSTGGSFLVGAFFSSLSDECRVEWSWWRSHVSPEGEQSHSDRYEIWDTDNRIRYTQTAYQLDSTDGGFSDNLEGMLHLCMLLLDRPPWIHCIHRAMFGCTEVSIHIWLGGGFKLFILIQFDEHILVQPQSRWYTSTSQPRFLTFFGGIFEAQKICQNATPPIKCDRENALTKNGRPAGLCSRWKFSSSVNAPWVWGLGWGGLERCLGDARLLVGMCFMCFFAFPI